MSRTGSRRRRRVALVLLPALVLGGCGASSGGGRGDAAPTTLSAAASKGLSYTLQITVRGREQCTTETYQTALPDGRPSAQTTHSCGPPAAPGHPVLIQARSSRKSMVVDVAPNGCATVRGGRTPAALRALPTRCSGGKAQFRVTVLPPVRRLLLVGIPGLRVISFSHHPCRTNLCLTPLA